MPVGWERKPGEGFTNTEFCANCWFAFFREHRPNEGPIRKLTVCVTYEDVFSFSLLSEVPGSESAGTGILCAMWYEAHDCG